MNNQRETLKLPVVDSEKVNELGEASPRVMKRRNGSRELEDKIGIILCLEDLSTHGVMVNPNGAACELS